MSDTAEERRCGHTAVIHTTNAARVERFARAMPAGRILVNASAAQGCCGMTTGLDCSLTLGCGTFGGNSTTDNVTYRHLLNIKRVAHTARPNVGSRTEISMTKITGGTPWTERMLGYVGLFLIGLIGAWADRCCESRQREDHAAPRAGAVRDRIRFGAWDPRALWRRMSCSPSIVSESIVQRTARRRIRPISLTPKALSLLEYFAARPGRLVKKTELLDAIWPGVFVADGALKVSVREIRRALGDDAQAPRYIETAHRRGYRFIADVTHGPVG